MFSWSLFNLQSALVLRCHRSPFLTGSLERLFIIPRPIPFVNTFFQKNSIFLKFSDLYSFPELFRKENRLLNTFRYEIGTFAPFSQLLIFRKIRRKHTVFKKLVKNFRFAGWIFIITHLSADCKQNFYPHTKNSAPPIGWSAFFTVVFPAARRCNPPDLPVRR